MKSSIQMALATAIMLTGITAAYADECAALKRKSDIIYASKGFCFKNPDPKSLNDNCHTTKPKFSPQERQMLESIKKQMKSKDCKE
jgi:hypothetical protein